MFGRDGNNPTEIVTIINQLGNFCLAPRASVGLLPHRTLSGQIARSSVLEQAQGADKCYV